MFAEIGARWYANNNDYSQFLEEDNIIRGFLEKKLRFASVPRIVIERASTRTRVTIWTARPGIVIGRKGQELDALRESLNRVVGKDVRLEIQEIKKPDLVASLVAENVALQLERRIAFRRAIKKAGQTTMSMGAKGFGFSVRVDLRVLILPEPNSSARVAYPPYP